MKILTLVVLLPNGADESHDLLSRAVDSNEMLLVSTHQGDQFDMIIEEVHA